MSCGGAPPGWPAGVHVHDDDLCRVRASSSIRCLVPDAARERILVEKDAERLERWLEVVDGATTALGLVTIARDKLPYVSSITSANGRSGSLSHSRA